MKQLENELCINFTYKELARLNTIVGVALRSGKIEMDDISDSIHKKIADEIINYNSNSANASGMAIQRKEVCKSVVISVPEESEIPNKMKKEISKKCLLKKFGILDVNKNVEYRIHPNPELLYVYFYDDWHTVPKEDVDIPI